MWRVRRGGVLVGRFVFVDCPIGECRRFTLVELEESATEDAHRDILAAVAQDVLYHVMINHGRMYRN